MQLGGGTEKRVVVAVEIDLPSRGGEPELIVNESEESI